MAAIESYREVRFDADPEGCWNPPPLEPGVMHVLYVNGIPTMCEYLCPCGCGAPCPTFFPTDKRKRGPERHLWDFSVGPNGPTLSPSVKHRGGCKSHYDISDGKVKMHADSGK
jgi:hypothetical protein